MTANVKFEGLNDDTDSANFLAKDFKLTCSPDNVQLHNDQSIYYKNKLCSVDVSSVPPIYITVDLIDTAIQKIANNTASSHDNIAIEHFKFAHPSLIIILAKLFNICLALGVVPSDFCLGIITPIPKFKGHKKNVTADDFRGISVNPIASKIFEYCLLSFLDNLKTSDRQFGFKKGVGCLNSIHTVRKIVSYFTESGNTVNLGLIDLRKAFDKTNFYGILNKLLEKNININIIKVLESWLSNSCAKVKWNESISQEVPLTAGVRQGGFCPPCYSQFM